MFNKRIRKRQSKSDHDRWPVAWKQEFPDITYNPSKDEAVCG